MTASSSSTWRHLSKMEGILGGLDEPWLLWRAHMRCSNSQGDQILLILQSIEPPPRNPSVGSLKASGMGLWPPERRQTPPVRASVRRHTRITGLHFSDKWVLKSLTVGVSSRTKQAQKLSWKPEHCRLD